MIMLFLKSIWMFRICCLEKYYKCQSTVVFFINGEDPKFSSPDPDPPLRKGLKLKKNKLFGYFWNTSLFWENICYPMKKKLGSGSEKYPIRQVKNHQIRIFTTVFLSTSCTRLLSRKCLKYFLDAFNNDARNLDKSDLRLSHCTALLKSNVVRIRIFSTGSGTSSQKRRDPAPDLTWYKLKKIKRK